MLTEFVKAVEQSSNRVNSIYLVDAEKVVEQYEWTQGKQAFHSIGKTFAGLCLGFALEEKIILYDESLVDLYPELVTDENQDILARVKVPHLASMSMGQSNGQLMMDVRPSLKEKDWAQYVFNQPFDLEAGHHFTYTNAGFYLLVRAIQQRTALSINEFLKERLYQPLGIEDIEWEKDPLGFDFVAGGIVTKPATLIQLAKLFINKGVIDGQTIVNPDWLTQMAKPQNTHVVTNSYTDFYGIGLWGDSRKNYYRADGAFGQLIMVFPEFEKSVVIASEEADIGFLLHLVFETIVSKF